METVDRARERLGAWSVRSSQKSTDGWALVRAALLCDLCGLTLAQAAERLGHSESGVGKIRARHRSNMLDDSYARRVGELVVDALDKSGVRGGSRTVVELS